jgi:hypothetical protein
MTTNDILSVLGVREPLKFTNDVALTMAKQVVEAQRVITREIRAAATDADREPAPDTTSDQAQARKHAERPSEAQPIEVKPSDDTHPRHPKRVDIIA